MQTHFVTTAPDNTILSARDTRSLTHAVLVEGAQGWRASSWHSTEKAAERAAKKLGEQPHTIVDVAVDEVHSQVERLIRHVTEGIGEGSLNVAYFGRQDDENRVIDRLEGAIARLTRAAELLRNERDA